MIGIQQPPDSYLSQTQSQQAAAKQLTNEDKARLKVADYWANDPSVEHLSRLQRVTGLKKALQALDLI